MVSRSPCLLILLAALRLCNAQDASQWTERRNLGFQGPVRSVLTTVTRPNPDPRSQTQRKLVVDANPDWAVFDIQGRRIEFASAVSRDRFVGISKCTFDVHGTKVCTDSSGQRQEEAKQETKETTLADGSRETTYFLNGKMENREVRRFDEQGKVIGFQNYDGKGRLTSEDSTLFSTGGQATTSKIYDQSGLIVLNLRTFIPDSQDRIDRWSYDAEGRLVWHLALNADGEVLSRWYELGYEPKLSSSDSLGVYRPGLSVDYKFDELGSGRMEKRVLYTHGEDYLAPDREEYYNFDGVLDERVEMKYARDDHGNWTSRSVFVWDQPSNRMIEVERDSRTIRYY